ncbi:Tfp pilus assembly protein FimT/FimU [Patescibacteria group bacterium]
MKLKFQKGLTLIELLIVVAIFITLSTAIIITSGAMADRVRFVNSYQKSEGSISEARNRALSGESYPDVSDHDGDDLYDTDGDLILPNGYIVNFATDADGIITVSLYADLFTNASIPNQLDVNDDAFLMSSQLTDDIKFTLKAVKKGGTTVAITAPDNFSVIYKTPDASFELLGYPGTSLQIQIAQVDENNDVKRSKFLYMNYLYGIPELLNAAYLQ